MTDPRYLITGAFGCIGAWVVRNLVHEGAAVIALDASRDDHRLRLVLDPSELAKVQVIQGDITDLAALEKVVKDQAVTHLIHLAALQLPFCKADPSLGARVNVVGTVNLFEAARRAGITHLSYASSVGVFGLSDEYPDGIVRDDSDPRPHSLYGVYKQANEGTARVYAWDYGISSVGLRPYVVYGPGRDQGMTSSPTWAMLAAAAGRPYQVTYGGRSGLNYVDDIARLFIQSSRVKTAGAEAFNVSGSLVDMPEILEVIFKVIPEARGLLTFKAAHLPLPDGMDDSRLRAALPAFQQTPLGVGVAQTIAHFRQALQDGRIRADQLPGMIVLPAVESGAAAQTILAAGEPGTVIGLTSRGIFCATASGQVVFVSFEAWRGPLTINLIADTPPGEEADSPQRVFRKGLPPFDKVVHSSPIAFRAGELRFVDQDIRVQTGQRAGWLSIWLALERANLPAVRERYQQVAREVVHLSAGKGWSRLLERWTGEPGERSFDGELQKVGRDLEQFEQALRSRDLEGALGRVTRLLGRGSGLTPSGDDVVAGFLLALNRLMGPGPQNDHFFLSAHSDLPKGDPEGFALRAPVGEPRSAKPSGSGLADRPDTPQKDDVFNPQAHAPFYDDLKLRLIALADQKTTWLSAGLIACAAAGQADERLVTALDGSLSGRLPPAECTRRLLAYGSSSGADAWLGIGLALF